MKNVARAIIGLVGCAAVSIGCSAETSSGSSGERLRVIRSALAGSDVLNANESLSANQSIVSGGTVLVYQGDGNLVLYRDGVALWDSGTWGQSPNIAVMQGDCNFVVYNNGWSANWASNTWGQGSGCFARVVHGDWMVCNGSTKVWSARGAPYDCDGNPIEETGGGGGGPPAEEYPVHWGSGEHSCGLQDGDTVTVSGCIECGGWVWDSACHL